MRAIVYPRLGDTSGLEPVERLIPDPQAGEIRVRLVTSGVNPTDWKSRSGAFGSRTRAEPTVPNHDGAGTVDAVGPGVDGFGVGDRVWVPLAGDGRPASATAQEYTVVPAERAFALAAAADFDLGASTRRSRTASSAPASRPGCCFTTSPSTTPPPLKPPSRAAPSARC